MSTNFGNVDLKRFQATNNEQPVTNAEASKKPKPSELYVYTKGQLMKNGFNAAVAGLSGNIPLSKKGNTQLSVYGGVGNILQAGAKISHALPIVRDKLYFTGSAGFEGNVSLFNKKQYGYESFSDTQKMRNLQSEIIKSETEVPFDGSVNFENQEVNSPNTMTIQTTNVVDLNSDIDVKRHLNNQTILPNNQVEGFIEGELRYENNNFYVGAGAKLGAVSSFKPEVDSAFSDVDVGTSNCSRAVYENNYVMTSGHYDESIPEEYYHIMWSETNMDVDYKENLDLNNIKSSNSLETKVKLVKPELKFSPVFRAGYKKNNFIFNMEADLQRISAGVNYAINNNSAKNIGSYKFNRKFSDKERSRMNLSVVGQMKDGINGVGVALDGNTALNDSGTRLDGGFALGHMVKSWLNVKQELPINSNFSANFGVGVEGAVALDKRDDDFASNTEVESSKDTEILDGDIISSPDFVYQSCDYFHSNFLLNDNAEMTVNSKVSVPRHNIYAKGSAGISYTNRKKNFSAGVDLVGGIRTKLEPKTEIKNEIKMSSEDSFAGYYYSGIILLDMTDPSAPSSLTGLTLMLDDRLYIDKNVKANQEILSKTYLKPSVTPFAGVETYAEYKISDNLSIGAEAGITKEFSDSSNKGLKANLLGTFKCRIK